MVATVCGRSMQALMVRRLTISDAQVELGLRAALGRNEGDAPIDRGRGDIAREVIPADHVENDVRPTAPVAARVASTKSLSR